MISFTVIRYTLPNSRLKSVSLEPTTIGLGWPRFNMPKFSVTRLAAQSFSVKWCQLLKTIACAWWNHSRMLLNNLFTISSFICKFFGPLTPLLTQYPTRRKQNVKLSVTCAYPMLSWREWPSAVKTRNLLRFFLISWKIDLQCFVSSSLGKYSKASPFCVSVKPGTKVDISARKKRSWPVYPTRPSATVGCKILAPVPL